MGLLFLLLLLFGGGLHFYWHHQIKTLSQRRESLLLTRERLKTRILRLQKDPSAYEDLARQKYGLIKDGERLIILKD